jgi:quercetin dioxygenase-like cupin family protein
MTVRFLSGLSAAALSLTFAGAALAQNAPAAGGGKVTPLFGTPLKGLPGKEGIMLTVEYAPGGSDAAHRHDAHVFVYVLEGSVIMKVKGKPEVTLKAGETYYEDPKDIHEVSKNASATAPAKFLAVVVKKKGVAPVLPPK